MIIIIINYYLIVIYFWSLVFPNYFVLQYFWFIFTTHRVLYYIVYKLERWRKRSLGFFKLYIVSKPRTFNPIIHFFLLVISTAFNPLFFSRREEQKNTQHSNAHYFYPLLLFACFVQIFIHVLLSSIKTISVLFKHYTRVLYIFLANYP